MKPKSPKELARERMLEVFEHFGNPNKTASALGVSHQYVYQWEALPLPQAMKLEGVKRHWTMRYLRPDKYEAVTR